MKKLLALLLAVIMVISMAACAPTEPDTTTEAPKGTTAAPAGTTVAATTTEPALDLTALPFVEPGSKKLTIGIQINGTVLDYEDNSLTKYIEESTGIDIEPVFFSSDTDEARKQLSLMVAAKEKLPDIIIGILDESMRLDLGHNGYLVDQTEYFEKYSYYHKNYVESLSEAFQTRIKSKITDLTTGAIYAFPSINVDYGVGNVSWAGGINMAMAKNVGMDPEEIDTVAEVYDYLKATVKGDGNQNGENDELGLLYYQGLYNGNIEQWIINAYVYCNDSELFNVTDGKVWSPYASDEYREAMIEMNKWYAEGLISPLCYSLTTEAEMKALINKPENYTATVYGGHTTRFATAGDDFALQYTSIKHLADETGKGGWAVLKDNLSCSLRGYITTDCEDPVLAFRLMDFLCADTTMHYQRFGEEGVHWAHYDGEAEGHKDGLGNWAGLKIIKDEFSTETKANWHVLLMQAGDPIGQNHGTNYVDFSDPGHFRIIVYKNLWDRQAGKMPAELARGLVYEEEELETKNEYWDLYTQYVLQSRAQMITGVIDPNDDAAWEKYVEELEFNGESELMDIVQEAYNRLNG